MRDDIVLASLRTAAAALERAQTLRPLELTKEAEIATRAVTRARDVLIARLREAGEGAYSTPERILLDEVNAILSQVIAVQFPAAGVNREGIAKTREVLANVIRTQEARAVP